MTLDLSPAMRENIAMQPEVAQAVIARDVRKTFEFKPVLRSVSLTVPAGATVALLGPNGAGKTTLLRILATLARPSAGEVTIDGLDLPATRRTSGGALDTSATSQCSTRS